MTRFDTLANNAAMGFCHAAISHMDVVQHDSKEVPGMAS